MTDPRSPRDPRDPHDPWSPAGGWGPGGPWGSGTWGDRRRWRRRQRRHGWNGPGGPGCLGCLGLVVIGIIALLSALATWVAGMVLGLLSPDAAPSRITAVAVVLVVVVGVGLVAWVFVRAVGPLAEIAAATRRLGDGEAGVRVSPRGPRPVRGLGISFNAMADRLDRSRDTRRAMLADVTHELRTPLTVVSGGLEAMLDGVHPMDEDHLAPLLAETAVMERLLEDLRTLSLAEAGALTLHREPCDLVALAVEVAAAQRPIADPKGVRVATAGDARLVTSVDPVRAREILVNLVANAIRHTPSGGQVLVTVRRDGGSAVLDVTDTGDGIAAEDLPRIFDRYHRRADSGGTGLGLAIVASLVAAHGGEVSASSTGVPGEGARFLVVLPLRD